MTTKTCLIAALGLMLGGFVAVPVADAQSHSRTKYHRAQPAKPPVYDDSSRWYPNNADKLKIGSRIWWDQMQREGRLGGGGGGGQFRR